MIKKESVSGQEFLHFLVSHANVDEEFGWILEGCATLQTQVPMDPLRQVLAVVLDNVVGFQILQRLGAFPALLTAKLSLLA